MNFTITVPPGTTNHGNPRLLCIPPKWYNYVVFYFTNYFAHAATIITFLRQGFTETFITMLLALLLPSNAVRRASENILRCARIYRKDPLKQAAHVGGLCMVVKEAKMNPQATNQDIELSDSRPGLYITD